MARIEFDHDVESSQALLFPLRRLTADLAAFLAGRDGGVQRFTLVLEHERCADSEVVGRPARAERDPAMLFELARGRLEQAQRAGAGARLAPGRATNCRRSCRPARDLFDTRPQQAVPWAQLRERLRARLGDDAVYGIGACAGPSPGTRIAVHAAASRVAADARLRPGWLLPQPMPLRDHALRVLAGPERIESGLVGRRRRAPRLLRGRDLAGQRAWAFCAPPVNRPAPFMLHGWFA